MLSLLIDEDLPRTLLTADVGFANVLRFPLERHHGIVVA
jgi:hypothetical protein